MQKYKKIIYRILAVYTVVVLVIVGVVVFRIVQQEVRTSKYQAKYLSKISKQLDFKLADGPSKTTRYPGDGPYDLRLGYSRLPDFIKRLDKAGFTVNQQAVISPMMAELIDEYGLFNIYHEKSQAGLRILDRADQEVFSATFPEHGYPNFYAIPPVILNTLLYIENRELLNEKNPQVNPAIEWDRFGFAGLQLIANKVGAGNGSAGGSTLATQIEKYRHSPNGYTNSITDKFRQMGTASIRAYLMGPDTRAMRQEIALSYLNSMPLAATPQFGEVHGLGDGLAAWLGADFNEVNTLLNAKALETPNVSKEQAIAYRQILSVLLSQRRPTYLLGRGFKGLQNLTDSYLRLLAEQGIISNALRDAALNETTVRAIHAAPTGPTKFAAERKTQSVLRSRLAKTLGIKTNYELDRLDLTVKTTLDYPSQQATTEQLRQLDEADKVRSAGIVGKKMLGGTGASQLDPIVYSLMLYERGESGNLLRVQTDNYDQALDINEGIRIDLGSTSKLRTLVHYLELVADAYEQYKGKTAEELNQIQLHPRDYLSAWVFGQLKANPNISLQDLLYKVLEKPYSANPGEAFFTGGGLHTFSNFSKNDNRKTLSLRQALRHSINLPFIRLMRDVVYHHLYKPDGIARWLEIEDDPRREEYLQRFADREGMVYMRRFYARYRDKAPEDAVNMLAQRLNNRASRLVMLFRSVYPQRDETALRVFLADHMDDQLSDGDISALYNKYAPSNFDLQDRGYITKIHPLELWMVGYMVQHPKSNQEELFAAGAEPRQDVYRWLIKSQKKNAQQQRIMTLLETDAFWKIHQAWQRVGYPFEALTPSYATALGASGDRPAALAELMGILQNDGVRLPMVRFENFQFAKNTPYETMLSKKPEQGERIFAPEVAKAARSALIGVVEGGTASRLKDVYKDIDGKALVVGGKTGTGDHRKEVYGKGGRLLESKFISRAAVFTFFIGERFFGVITAYVTGDDAGSYHFTSMLPVQILRHLKPTLTPLLSGAPAGEGVKGKPGSDATTAPKINSNGEAILSKPKAKVNKPKTVKKPKPSQGDIVLTPAEKEALRRLFAPLINKNGKAPESKPQTSAPKPAVSTTPAKPKPSGAGYKRLQPSPPPATTPKPAPRPKPAPPAAPPAP